MSKETKSGKPDLTVSTKEFFSESLETAFKHFHFSPHPLSRTYLIDLLERYMLSHNFFDVDQGTGRYKQSTLAETFLKAQQATPAVRMDLLKKLGDTSLYVSGFFGDSLNRKLVDIDYYVEMGGVAYNTLSKQTSDETMSEVFDCFANRFVEFVDVLTYMSQKTQVQTDKDLLRLYDRYLATGSKLAEEQLLEKGVLNSELGRAKALKQ